MKNKTQPLFSKTSTLIRDSVWGARLPLSLVEPPFPHLELGSLHRLLAKSPPNSAIGEFPVEY